MKKAIYVLLITQLLFNACSDNLNDSFNVFLDEWEPLKAYNKGICTSVKDAYIYPDRSEFSQFWPFFDISLIPDETLCTMSTCGLLETLLNHPTTGAGPWFTTEFAHFVYPGFDLYNNRLKSNKVAVELYKRSDVFPVLASKYLTIIQKKAESQIFGIYFFEMLLANEMCMEALNEREKVMSVAMALERSKQFSWDYIRRNETFHIMAVTMRSCNYVPFLNEVGTKWDQWCSGYNMCWSEEYQAIIFKYAQQFINEKK